MNTDLVSHLIDGIGETGNSKFKVQDSLSFSNEGLDYQKYRVIYFISLESLERTTVEISRKWYYVHIFT